MKYLKKKIFFEKNFQIENFGCTKKIKKKIVKEICIQKFFSRKKLTLDNFSHRKNFTTKNSV